MFFQAELKRDVSGSLAQLKVEYSSIAEFVDFFCFSIVFLFFCSKMRDFVFLLGYLGVSVGFLR